MMPMSWRSIADDMERRIRAGEWTVGERIPTTQQVAAEYEVSEANAYRALARLVDHGVLVGQSGRGRFVAAVEPGRTGTYASSRRLVRDAHGRDLRAGSGSTSPFARDAAAAGHTGGWEHSSAHDTATDTVADRLGIAVGDPVMRTDYRFTADAAPVQLSTSWEPLSITGGTDVEWPEDGAAVGVVARMDRIGRRIDEFVERVTARPGTDDEVARLLLTTGAPVLAIARTYYAGAVPVETADIVIGGDRYELVYRVPVD
jgi:DNA-binding GntR family transcriptional regulator